MNFFALIFLILAGVLFAVDAALRKAIVPAGLCALCVALLIQFAATSHTVVTF